MKFEVGQTYYIRRGVGAKPYKIHILAIIEEDKIAFKWYGKHKQWWHYEIMSKNELAIEMSWVKKNRKESI